MTALNLSIIPIAAGIQAVGPWPMIVAGLVMIVVAGREIRTAWRDYNQTFPRCLCAAGMGSARGGAGAAT